MNIQVVCRTGTGHAGKIAVAIANAPGLQGLSNQGIPAPEKGFICPGNCLCFRRGRPNQKDLADAADFALPKAGKT